MGDTKIIDTTPLEKLMAESAEEEKEFRNMIPTTGFLGAYMKYTDYQESPGSYHFWVALSVLSGVIQRRAWISKGVYNVYPNIYMILVAPSGRCRKSRALNLGTELIQDFDFMNVIADKTTPESMLEALMTGTNNLSRVEDQAAGVINLNVDSTGFIKAGELSVFLNKQTYTSGMVNLLTDLYDCPRKFKYLTRNKKPVELKNVAVTFVGASTPDWLATSLPEAAFEGGFMSRIIFVVKHYKDRSIALPMDPPKGTFEELQRQLTVVRKLFRGRIELSQAARSWYVDWYNELEKEQKQEEAMSGFVERKPDTLLKVAMLMNASNDPEKRLIQVDELKQAERIVTWTQARMFKAFKNVDMTHIGRLSQKILEMLEQRGAMTRRDVMRSMGSKINGVRELEEVEQILAESGQIEIQESVNSGRGRPTRRYIKL